MSHRRMPLKEQVVQVVFIIVFLFVGGHFAVTKFDRVHFVFFFLNPVRNERIFSVPIVLLKFSVYAVGFVRIFLKNPTITTQNARKLKDEFRIIIIIIIAVPHFYNDVSSIHFSYTFRPIHSSDAHVCMVCAFGSFPFARNFIFIFFEHLARHPRGVPRNDTTLDVGY